MAIVVIILLGIAGIVLTYYVLRFLVPWGLGLLDRAALRDPDILLLSDELPCYHTRNPDGQADTGSRRAGWDGWHAYVLPAAGSTIQMARCTIMTGLYGLEGIDNFEKLMWRLSGTQVVEHLCWIPVQSQDEQGSVINNLSQQYLPKASDLLMETERLKVTALGSQVNSESREEPYGQLRGTWPDYEFEFLNPEAEAKLSLHYRAEKVLWWSDFRN